MKKQLFSALLALCMALALLPGTAWAAEKTSGDCGDGVTWSYKDGVLTIQGKGSMDDYYSQNLDENVAPPWEAYQEEIRTIRIGDGVASIGNGAFMSCGSLTSVTIPDSVKTIGSSAFMNCGSLNGVTIPDGVETIDEMTFAACSSLASVTIPESVTTIGWMAFDECTGLTNVYYASGASQWEEIDIDEGNDPLYSIVIRLYASSASGTPGTTAKPSTGAVLSPQKLTVDGEEIDCEKYNIGGNNYFKLRDLAYALNGSDSQFGVGYDEATSTVSITTGAIYSPYGTELEVGADKSRTAQISSQTILIDGEEYANLTVYNIGGNNFFQLRELGDALGFEVDFDASSNTAIVRSTQG